MPEVLLAIAEHSINRDFCTGFVPEEKLIFCANFVPVLCHVFCATFAPTLNHCQHRFRGGFVLWP